MKSFRQVHLAMRVLLISIVVLSSSTLLVTSVWAVGIDGYLDYAWGSKPITNLVGFHSNIWSAQHPSGNIYNRAFVAICRPGSTCRNSSSSFETGLHRGTASECPYPNVLQQYASWDSSGSHSSRCNLGFLNDNSWYNFQVQFNSTLDRWEASRNGVVVFGTANNLGFATGTAGLCGAGGTATDYIVGHSTISAECSGLQFRVNGGAWTSVDYSSAEKQSGYCVTRPYNYGVLGWGPC